MSYRQTRFDPGPQFDAFKQPYSIEKETSKKGDLTTFLLVKDSMIENCFSRWRKQPRGAERHDPPNEAAYVRDEVLPKLDFK